MGVSIAHLPRALYHPPRTPPYAAVLFIRRLTYTDIDMARKRDKQQATALELQLQALELRKSGKSFRAIGQALGISYQTASNYIRAELARLAALNFDSAVELRQLELERLDAAYNAIVPFVEAGSPPHIMAFLRIVEQRAKLLGLYAPVKQDVTFDVKQMTNDERISRITELLDTARTRGIGRADNTIQ